MTIEIFVCYAREDGLLLQEFKTHLQPLKRLYSIEVWHDRDITAGKEWEQEISQHLNHASIIILLISPDFIASDYCYSKEMQRALERHRAREARVVPILLRPGDIEGMPFRSLNRLPSNGQPVTKWLNRDEALEDIAKGMRRIVQELLLETSVDSTNPPDQPFSKRDSTPQKMGPVWIIILLFVLAEVIQITCVVFDWGESLWSITGTIFTMLVAITMLLKVPSKLPDWPLFKSSYPFIKMVSSQLFQNLFLVLLILTILALPTFASFSATQVYRLEFPPSPGSGNLLTNASFEQGTAKWACTSGMDIQIQHEGARSWLQAKNTVSTSEVICYQKVQYKPQKGKTYTASIWVYAATNSVGGWISLWMDNDSIVGQDNNHSTAFIASSSNWSQVKTSFSVSQSSFTSMRIEIGLHANQGYLDATSAQLIQNA